MEKMEEKMREVEKNTELSLPDDRDLAWSFAGQQSRKSSLSPSFLNPIQETLSLSGVRGGEN